MEKVKRHSTKLNMKVYADLKRLQITLIDVGYDISLNDVLSGCIRYVNEKGITNSDVKFFRDNG
jgi:hypothetical protein